MFPNSSVPVIGITGPSGAGKTTAAKLLAAQGCAVMDGDALAREITVPGSLVLEELAAAFGEDILGEDGALNRPLLGQRAFESEEGRQTLNEITHPAITALAIKRAAALPAGTPAIALDAAALPENELAQFLDHIVLIEAPESLRLARIMARDGISRERAQQRMEMQKAIQYVPSAGLGYTTLKSLEGLKSDESEAAWSHALSQILERIVR